MERHDRDLILQLMGHDVGLRKLYERHLKLEEVLDNYNSCVFMTPEEEVEERRLKKEKLNGVDRMMGILISYREGQGEMVQAIM